MATIGGGAPHAVTQRVAAYGTSGQQTTTSTSDVDLADMSVTLTTTGGDLLCTAYCVVGNSSTASGNTYITFYLDGSVVGSTAFATPGINYWDTVATTHIMQGVAAGSHTVKLRWHVDAGTAVANGSNRSLVVVELKR